MCVCAHGCPTICDHHVFTPRFHSRARTAGEECCVHRTVHQRDIAVALFSALEFDIGCMCACLEVCGFRDIRSPRVALRLVGSCQNALVEFVEICLGGLTRDAHFGCLARGKLFTGFHIPFAQSHSWVSLFALEGAGAMHLLRDRFQNLARFSALGVFVA